MAKKKTLGKKPQSPAKQSSAAKSTGKTKKKPSAKSAAPKGGAKAAKKKSSAKSAPPKPPTKRGGAKQATVEAAPVAASKVPTGGPLTLEEARALATAKGPVRALRRGGAPAAEAATNETVGIARKELAQEQEQERERRIAEYKAMMELLKKRGVAPGARVGTSDAGTSEPGTSGRRRGTAGPGARRGGGAITQPLQVLAEGDSWFDYPFPTYHGGIIKRLEGRLGVPILNLAKAGDEVRFMLGVKERTRLIECIREGSPAGGHWDVLLFSGGGNDIVDNPMALWVKEFAPNVPASALIHQKRFESILGLVRAGYEDLIELRDELSPQTTLVFHGYDYAIPDGRDVCFIGPWLKPTFDLRKFPTQAAGFGVVKEMLQQFAALLSELEQNHPKVVFINAQGTLKPVPASWHNELHPNREGFDAFASIFHTRLKELFPAQVF